MSSISESVGKGGVNNQPDVLTIQQLLNAHVENLGLAHLKEDGLIGDKTNEAIREYQEEVMEMVRPDGRVDPDGRTWRSLTADTIAAGTAATEAGAAAVAKKSSSAFWTWDQSSGTLLKEARVLAHGYAGAGRGENNPAMEGVAQVGPIPRGLWRMIRVKNGGPTGPFTIVLEPEPGTDTHGRSAFRIHGDNSTHDASQGCIILQRPFREQIWATHATHPLIEVVE
jgi:peptidoglycan hydrolase-like protein with peptidoglycan-binding domain